MVERVDSWKGGMRAAYSILHEDLADASTGTLQIAVPALRTRGLRAGLATCVSLCSDSDWMALRTLASEGFEIANHGWWHQSPTPETAAHEIEESRREIQRKSGSTVSFYACPDAELDEELARFAIDRGHLGCREGRSSGMVAQPDVLDPLRIPHDAFGSCSAHGDPSRQMDAFLDSVLDQGGWGIRSLRGVSDTSWEPIPECVYVSHLDRLEKLSRANELWVAPPSEILRHALARQAAGEPKIEGSLLHFPAADPSGRVRAFLSVVIRCHGKIPGRLSGEQNGAPILCRRIDDSAWRVEVHPWDPVVLDAVPG